MTFAYDRAAAHKAEWCQEAALRPPPRFLPPLLPVFAQILAAARRLVSSSLSLRKCVVDNKHLKLRSETGSGAKGSPTVLTSPLRFKRSFTKTCDFLRDRLVSLSCSPFCPRSLVGLRSPTIHQLGTTAVRTVPGLGCGLSLRVKLSPSSLLKDPELGAFNGTKRRGCGGTKDNQAQDEPSISSEGGICCLLIRGL